MTAAFNDRLRPNEAALGRRSQLIADFIRDVAPVNWHRRDEYGAADIFTLFIPQQLKLVEDDYAFVQLRDP